MVQLYVPEWQAEALEAINRSKPSGGATASELISYCIECEEDLSKIVPVQYAGSSKKTIKLYLPVLVKRRLEKQARKNMKAYPGGDGIAGILRGVILKGLTCGRGEKMVEPAVAAAGDGIPS